MEIAKGEHWQAIVWYNTSSAEHDCVETHAVAAKNARGRWLTRAVMRAHEHILRLTGHKYASAQLEHTPIAARIWRGFGYYIHGDTAIRRIDNGQHLETRWDPHWRLARPARRAGTRLQGGDEAEG